MRAYLYFRKVLLIIFITLLTYPNKIHAQDTLIKPLSINVADSLEFTKENERFLKNASNDSNPFFLYLALPSPHTSWLASDQFKGTSEIGD